MWTEKYPESVQRILKALAFNKSLKASEISRITGFNRQTVYKGLASLLKDEKIEISNKGISKYALSKKVDPNEILSFFESDDKYGISTLDGKTLDSIHVPEKFRGTFFDFGFVPTRGLFGCRLYLESIPKSAIVLFRDFSEMLRGLHYRLEEIYWTIDTYYGSEIGADYGVGIESFVKSISQERKEKKAAINVSFVVQDLFGGYFGFLYNIQGRWINQDMDEGILDEVKLCVVLDKIPIGKKFAISWNKSGQLPFVEEYIVRVEKVIDAKIKLNEGDLVGFVDRFGHEIIFNMPPRKGLPTKILARTRWANMTIEDLTSGKTFPFSVLRYNMNPRYSVEPPMITSVSPEIQLICAVISED